MRARGRAAPAERRLPRERAKATGIGRKPSPSGRSAAAYPAGCRGSTRGRRKSGEIRRPWDASRQNPSPSGRSAAACPAGCHGSTRGRNAQVGPFALGAFRGRRRRPRAAARQLTHRGTTGVCKGDGNQAKSVTLGAFRGKIRLPRGVPRHLPCGLLKTPATPARPHLAFRYHVAHED